MKISFKNCFFLGLTAGILSCGKVKTVAEYRSWMGDQSNGLVLTHVYEPVKIIAQYQPHDYLAYREWDKKSLVELDTLTKAYEKSLTFSISIGSTSPEMGGDIIMGSSQTFKEYAYKLETMSFKMQEMVSLVIDGKTYSPVLTRLSNHYELTQERSITLVFVPETLDDKVFYEGNSYELIYNDELLNLGKQQFVFEGEQLRNTPNIKSLLVAQAK